MAGRTRSDSLHMKVELFDDTVLSPPAHCTLSKADMPHWDAIITAKAKSAWTVIDLEHAANLARTFAKIEKLQKEMCTESDVVENDKGKLVMNPKHAVLELLIKRAVSLSRHIHVHATATVGEADKQRGKNSAASKAHKLASSIANDGLLARPS